MEALHTKAFYVGAIGLRRNNQDRRERLIQHFDLSAAQLNKLRGPIGIDISRKTPAEELCVLSRRKKAPHRLDAGLLV
jgi:xanthine dehydrogenase accessory factor